LNSLEKDDSGWERRTKTNLPDVLQQLPARDRRQSARMAAATDTHLDIGFLVAGFPASHFVPEDKKWRMRRSSCSGLF
jgi:hypothetical protein